MTLQGFTALERCTTAIMARCAVERATVPAGRGTEVVRALKEQEKVPSGSTSCTPVDRCIRRGRKLGTAAENSELAESLSLRGPRGGGSCKKQCDIRASRAISFIECMMGLKLQCHIGRL